MIDLYLFRIREIMEGPKKVRWDSLKTLQIEAKENLSHPVRRPVLGEISTAFTAVSNERKSNALELERLISSVDGSESSTMAQQLLDELDIFPKDLSKLSRFYAVNEQKKLDKIILGTKFSQLAIPDIDNANVRTIQVPPHMTETDLNPINDIFSIIFNFGDKKAEFRAQQYQYIYACFEGVSTRRDVVIEGPTGLGKTRALLASTIPYLLANPKARLVYATRTVTQVNNVMDEIKDVLAQNDLDITATLYIGSNRLRNKYAKCYDAIDDFEVINAKRAERDPPLPPIDDSFCNKNCSRFNSRHNPTFNLNNARLVTIDTLKETGDCPRGVMEKAAKEAKIVVIPHNQLYDSYLMDEYNLGGGILIVDEAHNFLEDAAKNPYLTIGERNADSRPDDRQSNLFYLEDMISHFLNAYDHKKPGHSINLEDLELREAVLYIQCLYHELFDHVRTQYNEKNKILHEDSPPGYFIEDICGLVDRLNEEFKANVKRLADYFTIAKNHAKEDGSLKNAIKEGTYSYSQFLDALVEIIKYPMEYVLVSCEGELKFYNLHPKKNVDCAIERFISRIFTSATLSPQKDVAYLLGLKDPITAKIDPVFPASNYEHFFVIGANSSSKEELREHADTFNASEHKVIEEMFDTAIGAASGRNIGIFCNSVPAVIETYEILKSMQIKHNFLLLPFIQGDRYAKNIEIFSGDYQKALEYLHMIKNTFTDDDVIEVFKALGDYDRTAIILGVQGGTLSEGMDYKAKQMEMVITLGLPYPASVAEIRMNKARQDYFFMQGKDRQTAEDLAFKQVAYRKVAQSIGRSHRSMTDRAVVILADERLLGIKNVQNDPPNRYEFISLYNAEKNLRLLQEPVQRLRNNLVIGGSNHDENRSIADYISTGLNVTRKDFIDFRQMGIKIKKFYR